jgi:transcriptional regulator with XRE-family HTH domain
VSTPDYQRSLGRKIAAERKRRGLSQPELAKVIGRSVAWVSQVERGVRRIDRMSVLEALASALDVPLGELAADAPIVAAVVDESPVAGGLRLVLSGVHSLRAMLNGHDSPGLDSLRTRTEKVWELTHAGRHAELTELLRVLIPDLETAARALPAAEQSQVFELMASAYQACSAALAKIGEPDAAWIAADRSMSAAERSGHPLLVAAGAYRLGFVFISARQFDQAEETARTAADALLHLAEGGSPEAMSLWGALTLQRALIAARAGNADAAYAHLDRARQMAERIGDGRNDYNTEFGPTNTDLSEIAIAVDLGDAGRALRAAGTVDMASMSAERRARTLLDVARAHAQRRQVGEAVAALRQAEDTAPELLRGHYLVRQLVSDLRTMQDDKPDAELHELSVRLGIAGVRD